MRFCSLLVLSRTAIRKRKNPLAVIEAFERATASNDRGQLILKLNNAVAADEAIHWSMKLSQDAETTREFD
jgi:hypothetical protein